MVHDEFDVVDYEAGVSDEVKGRECRCCYRLLTWKFYRKDSSMKDGHALQCIKCEVAPKLSMAEHTSKLQQENFNSEGTKRQRHEDQSELKRDRKGRAMDASLFLSKLHHVCPNLYVTQGGIIGDLALYVTGGIARPEWNGATFKYLGYITLGAMPEFSAYEFDKSKDIMIRASSMGWRSVLLRFIENGVLTEQQCSQEFGQPSSGIRATWDKTLQNYRSSKI